MVRGSAQAWRNGLTAFISLVTTGIVIKGRDTTAGLTIGWRILVTVLIGGGLLLAVLGLWQALTAEAGTAPKSQTLQDIRTDHGTLAAYETYLATQAARRLQWGQRAVVVAITFLLAGIIAIWWAPTTTPSAAASMAVTKERHIVIPDAHQLRLTVERHSGAGPSSDPSEYHRP
jgi:hypothetical protein